MSHILIPHGRRLSRRPDLLNGPPASRPVDDRVTRPRPRWEAPDASDPRVGVPRDVMPPEGVNGILGQVIVSDDAESWLRSRADIYGDLVYAKAYHEQAPPPQFRPNWTNPQCAVAIELVSTAFHHGVLKGPDELRDLSIETHFSAWNNGAEWFMVTIAWQGLNGRLRLTTDSAKLIDLDLGDTVRGVEAAQVLLRAVAAQATSLLDDLAAEGARTAEYWYAAQAEADEEAYQQWNRRHRWQRLNRWLHQIFTRRRGHGFSSANPADHPLTHRHLLGIRR
jgi:hypothetical protein